MELVSVVINCYNGERYLREAMDSVFAQTYSNWEIIFWDNASTDHSGKIALSYGNKVKYFRSERKLTLGEARNQAFLKAQGNFIAILDADDIWLPEKLKRQIRLFDDPQVALTFTNAVSFNSQGCGYSAFNGTPTKKQLIFGELLKNNFIWSLTMMFRKEALQSLDYMFDGEFEIVCDYDLTLRLALLYKSAYLRECLAKWRVHSQNSLGAKSYLAARESIRLLEKLQSSVAQLRNDYAEEVKVYELLVYRKLAEEAWQRGDKKKVRFLLKNYWRIDMLSFLAYLGSWVLPSRLFTTGINVIQCLRHFWRRVVYGKAKNYV